MSKDEFPNGWPGATDRSESDSCRPLTKEGEMDEISILSLALNGIKAAGINEETEPELFVNGTRREAQTIIEKDGARFCVSVELLP